MDSIRALQSFATLFTSAVRGFLTGSLDEDVKNKIIGDYQALIGNLEQQRQFDERSKYIAKAIEREIAHKPIGPNIENRDQNAD